MESSRPQPFDSFQTLFSFTSLNSGGHSPRAPLVQVGDGDFYGTTSSGGETSTNCGAGCGTVFKIAGGDILVPEPGTRSASVAALVGLGLAAGRGGDGEGRATSSLTRLAPLRAPRREHDCVTSPARARPLAAQADQ